MNKEKHISKKNKNKQVYQCTLNNMSVNFELFVLDKAAKIFSTFLSSSRFLQVQIFSLFQYKINFKVINGIQVFKKIL